jgi:hypothetical protein
MEQLQNDEENSDEGDASDGSGQGEFVKPDQINTIKKTRREKIEELKQHKASRKQKGGGKTQKEQSKNKPAIHKIMARHRSLKEKLKSVNK